MIYSSSRPPIPFPRWEYYVDGAYQNLYMDQIPVSAAQEIVLSYNYSSFIW